MSVPRDIQAGVPQGSVVSVYLGLFADDNCIYATDHKDDYVLRKLQQVLSAIETCEHWNKNK
jgi:hypothetical protein